MKATVHKGGGGAGENSRQNDISAAGTTPVNQKDQ
jgi:hypothetical protein